MRNTKWIIEARNEDGSLNFDTEQPPVREFTEDALAEFVYARVSDDVVLHGFNIPSWPTNINPYWKARKKTW